MSSNTPKTILLLAVNPKDTPRLRLDKEVREIKEALLRARQREQFQLVQMWAVRPQDVRRAMLDEKPQIVHFSGHGAGEEGLVFEDQVGQPKLVTGETLAGLVKVLAEGVECVVLNGCYSQVQAEAVAQHIPYVVGMRWEIGDTAAIEFAVGFYDALGAGKTIDDAYKLGCNAIQLQGIAEHLTPVLLKREKVTGKVVAQDHKYDGELVLIELNFLNETENPITRQVCIVLNITFGEVDETIIDEGQEGFIRFGVKHGKLRLNLENGDMPLSNRNLCNEWHGNWWVTTTGESTAPIWEIQANGNPLILRGLHSNQQLGIIDLFNDLCVLTAVFKVSINSNDIEITAQDGVWNNNCNKKTKTTKLGVFFRKVLEPKIKDYVSQVVLNYGSATIS